MNKKHLLKHKKAWLVGGSIAFVALLATSAVYSTLSWRSYEQDYTDWKRSTKDVLDKGLALPATSDKERTLKLSELKHIKDATTKRQATICNTRPLSGWQADMVDSFKHSQTNCQAVAKKVGILMEELHNVTVYLDNERVLSDLLRIKELQLATADEKDWAASATAWKSLEGQVGALKVSLPFEPTKKVANQTVKAISSAWQEVLAAHAEKDKARFIKAQGQVNSAYDGFNVLKTTDDASMTTLLKSFDVAYSRALN